MRVLEGESVRDQPPAFSRFGARDGRPVVYFHGVPGSPDECALFDPYGKENGLSVLCYPRFALDPSLQGEAYYRALAREISRQTAGETVDLVGFSVGGFVALQTCRHLGAQVRSLHLVSAAAPLEAGGFLEGMAGSGVFRLARDAPLLFQWFCHAQGNLARFAPDFLFARMFAGAAGADKVLAKCDAFRAQIREALRSSLREGLAGYARDLRAYVQPWALILPEITVETHIWHGREDNWSPVGMAEYLGSALSACSQLELMAGLSHYSCLRRSAERICRQLARP